MLTLVNEDLDKEVYSFVVGKLKEKLPLFDYITEELFVENLRNGPVHILKSEHAVFFCETAEYVTGISTMSVGVVKLSDSVDEMAHLVACLKNIEGFAQRLGITRIKLEGRIGWTRIFKDYTTEKVTMYKDLQQL